MDGLDVRIIRAMGVRPYERRPKPLDALQPQRIAQVTGTSVNTVKERIARMTDAGVITGYGAFPNLSHLGLRAEAHYFQFPGDAEKEAAIAAVKRMDGMLELHDFLGRGLCADIAFHDDRDIKEKLAALRPHSGGIEVQRFYMREMPPVVRKLTPLDWRILAALRADPRAGPADLASVVGVSARTVKRHLSRMASEGSVFLVPLIDPSKADGLFIFELLVYLEEGTGPRPMTALRSEFNQEHIYAYVPATSKLGHFDMLLFARTSSDVEAIRRRAEGIPGVVRAEAWLFRAFIDLGRWIDPLIEQRAREVPA
jgi:DNA-binding Lrp family transcriptional regulator